MKISAPDQHTIYSKPAKKFRQKNSLVTPPESIASSPMNLTETLALRSFNAFKCRSYYILSSYFNQSELFLRKTIQSLFKCLFQALGWVDSTASYPEASCVLRLWSIAHFRRKSSRLLVSKMHQKVPISRYISVRTLEP